MHRSMAENAQQNFYKRFEKTAVTASEQHDYFMRQITQMIEKSQYEVNQVNQQLREVLDQRLDEMQRSQKRLIELVEGMQKDPISNSSSATQS